LTTSIVFTFIGADKPGLVERLSNTVAAHDGNWLESRMSQLAGQFAGITRVAITNDKADALRRALMNLSGDELTVVVQQGEAASADSASRTQQISILGNDRPGIVKEVSAALAAHHINVCEMASNITSAPMTADPLFEASVTIQAPASFDIDQLSDELDDIANELAIDISLDNE
jgi:glycine cleavage system regulatory protein